jgi:hypothetical protein
LVVNALGDRGIKCFAFGPDKLRFVTHLDNTPEQVNFALETIRKSKAGIL